MADIMQDKYILGQSQNGTIANTGQEIRLDLKLDPNTNTVTGGKITGKVTDPATNPISNALIKIMSADYEPLMHAMTNESGDYFINNVQPGNTYNIFAIGSGTKLKQGNQFTISQYEELTINFTLNPDPSMALGVIAGDLVDQSSNAAINGAVVSLFSVAADGTESLVAVTYTNQYGQYVFREVPIGNYIIKINALGYNPIESNVSVTTSGQLIPMNVSMTENANTSRGTVSGIITDTANQPIDRADVILYKVEADNSLTPKAFTKTTTSGIYLFANVAKGTYKVKANEIEIVTVNVTK